MHLRIKVLLLQLLDFSLLAVLHLNLRKAEYLPAVHLTCHAVPAFTLCSESLGTYISSRALPLGILPEPLAGLVEGWLPPSLSRSLMEITVLNLRAPGTWIGIW